MRVLFCFALLFVCLTFIPSINCDKKYKVAEYNERDRRDTKERYTRRDLEQDEDDAKYKRNKLRGREDDVPLKKTSRNGNDEDRKFARKINRRDETSDNRESKFKKFSKRDDDEPPRRNVGKYAKNDEEERVKTKFRAKQLQVSDEDDTTEETEEDDVSESCIKKKGNKCESPEDDTEETDEDDTEETDEDDTDEESDEVAPAKKQVTYVKKFAHEKTKSNKDKEMGKILKIHKKSGKFRDDDDSSEEVVLPKRRRFTYEDDDD